VYTWGRVSFFPEKNFSGVCVCTISFVVKFSLPFRGTSMHCQTSHCEIARRVKNVCFRVGPFSRRLSHFVAAALPKVPIRALKLGDRTSLAHNIRGLPSGLRRTRSTSVAVPPVRCRGLVCGQGVSPPEDVFLSILKSAPSSRRHTHFVAAALSRVPIHALELGDRTIIARVPRDLLTTLRRTRSTSVAAPPVRFRGLVWPGRFPARGRFSSSLEKCPIATVAYAFRGGGTPKSPYTRPQARRQDLHSRRSARNHSRA